METAHVSVDRRSTYNHLSSWLTDARNLTNPNTVSEMFTISLKINIVKYWLCNGDQWTLFPSSWLFTLILNVRFSLSVRTVREMHQADSLFLVSNFWLFINVVSVFILFFGVLLLFLQLSSIFQIHDMMDLVLLYQYTLPLVSNLCMMSLVFWVMNRFILLLASSVELWISIWHIWYDWVKYTVARPAESHRMH